MTSARLAWSVGNPWSSFLVAVDIPLAQNSASVMELFLASALLVQMKMQICWLGARNATKVMSLWMGSVFFRKFLAPQAAYVLQARLVKNVWTLIGISQITVKLV